MTHRHVRSIQLLAITAALVAMSHSEVRAQSACDGAEARLFDCAYEMCSVTTADDDCLGQFVGTLMALSEAVCDSEIAAAIQGTESCVELAATMPRAQSICELAFVHQLGCLEAFCAQNPGNSTCEVMLMAMADVDIAEEDCPEAMEEWANESLSSSCGEVLTTYGIQ